LGEISAAMDQISSRSPTLPDRVYDAAKTRASQPLISGTKMGTNDSNAPPINTPGSDASYNNGPSH